MKTMKTVTEKRFFEYHEDDISVTLRNKGGSFGGGAKCLLFALPRCRWGVVRNRLQMGATRASRSRKVNSRGDLWRR